VCQGGHPEGQRARGAALRAPAAGARQRFGTQSNPLTRAARPRRAQVLDRAFNACLQDFAPFTPSGSVSAEAGFPPMPPDVAAADARSG